MSTPAEPAPPAPPPGASPPGAPPPGARPPGPAAGGRARKGGTAADMLRSMVVIVALVVIVFVAVPRPQGRIEQPVDVASAVAQAETSGIEVSAPEVPAGWQANVATFEADPVEGLPTLSLGWVVPGGTFVGVRATRGATPAWTSGVTDDGEADGVEGEPTVVLGGREWERLVGGDGRRPSLLLDAAGTSGGQAAGPGGPVTYVVTGTAAEPDLERVAAQVVPG